MKKLTKKYSRFMDKTVNINQQIRQLSDKDEQAVREVANRDIEKRIKVENAEEC